MSLFDKIKERIVSSLDSKSLIELTNQRNPGAETAQEAVLDEAIHDAIDIVVEYLSDDENDRMAVRCGFRLTQIALAGTFSFKNSPSDIANEEHIINIMKSTRMARSQRSEIEIERIDTTNVDLMFPKTSTSD
jgi:hypothetical protein